MKILLVDSTVSLLRINGAIAPPIISEPLLPLLSLIERLTHPIQPVQAIVAVLLPTQLLLAGEVDLLPF